MQFACCTNILLWIEVFADTHQSLFFFRFLADAIFDPAVDFVILPEDIQIMNICAFRGAYSRFSSYNTVNVRSHDTKKLDYSGLFKLGSKNRIVRTPECAMRIPDVC